MASTTSRRGWASGRPPAAGVLVDLLVWLPKSLPGALFAAQTARHPAVTATVQPSAKAAQPTGSETGTQASRLQQVQKRAPVIRGGLDRHLLDPLPDQVIGKLGDRVGGGIHLPHLGDPPARPGGVRHPRAHHAGRLGHIDRGHPPHDLLVLLVLDLPRLPHRRTVSSPHRGQMQGCPGASVGSRKSDRRAPSTVRDPSRSRPQRQTNSTASTTRNAPASASNPALFSRLRGVPARDTRTDRKTTSRRPDSGPAERGGLLPMLTASPTNHDPQVTDLRVPAGSGPAEQRRRSHRPVPRCAFVLVPAFAAGRTPRYDEKMGKSVTSANAAATGPPGRVCGRWWPRPAAAAARPPARVPGPAQLFPGPLRHRLQRPRARPRTGRQRLDRHPGTRHRGRRTATQAAAAGTTATPPRRAADRRAGVRAGVRRRAGLPGGPPDPTGVAAGRGRRRAGRASRHGAAPDATDKRSASPADRPAGRPDGTARLAIWHAKSTAVAREGHQRSKGKTREGEP